MRNGFVRKAAGPCLASLSRSSTLAVSTGDRVSSTSASLRSAVPAITSFFACETGISHCQDNFII